MQGVALIRQARVQRFGQQVHMRLGRLAGQSLDGRPHLLQARTIHVFGKVDGVVMTNPDEGVEPDEVRLNRLRGAAIADDFAAIGVSPFLEILQSL